MNYILIAVFIVIYIMIAILTACVLDLEEINDDGMFLIVFWPILLVVGLFYLWYKQAKKISKRIRNIFGLE